MATLKCNDGTEIKISDETEQELRKAFGERKRFYIGEKLMSRCGDEYLLCCNYIGEGNSLGERIPSVFLVNLCSGFTKNGFYRRIPVFGESKKYVEKLPTYYVDDFDLDNSYKGDR